jgi:hypothetical protein
MLVFVLCSMSYVVMFCIVSVGLEARSYRKLKNVGSCTVDCAVHVVWTACDPEMITVQMSFGQQKHILYRDTQI